MPLMTEVKRDGKVKEYIWDHTMLSCFLTAAMQEEYPDWEFQEGRKIGEIGEYKFVDFSNAPIYYMDIPIPLWEKGEQILLEDHVYGDPNERLIEFKAGDKLKMWRS